MTLKSVLALAGFVAAFSAIAASAHAEEERFLVKQVNRLGEKAYFRSEPSANAEQKANQTVRAVVSFVYGTARALLKNLG